MPSDPNHLLTHFSPCLWPKPLRSLGAEGERAAMGLVLGFKFLDKVGEKDMVLVGES